jgi:hypothetical protein
MICVAAGAEALWTGWQVYRGIGGNFAMESVAVLPWNRWQVYRGISGNFAMERVATFAWNRWQLSRGIRTRPLEKVYSSDLT